MPARRGRQGAGERRVERARALRAAEDEQRRTVGGQAEPLAGLGPQRGAVQLGDRAAQRDAEDLRAGQAAGHRGGDAGGEPGADPVGQARAGVGLVHHDRHAAAGPEVGGQGDVAAEPDDDVGVDLREHLPHPADGGAHPAGQAQQVAVGLRGSGTGGISSAGSRGPGSAWCPGRFGAQRRDWRRGRPPQGVGERQRGLDMPGAAAAGDDDIHAALGVGAQSAHLGAAAGRVTGR